MLDSAKRKAEDLIQTLRPYAERGIPVIVLEPSCLSVFLDEMPSFNLVYPGSSLSLEQFLADRMDEIPLKEMTCDIKLHGHCHQKALEGTASAVKVAGSIPGATFSEIPSGCCGMAGSFGYERRHYDLSMKIGGLKLFREIAESDPKAFVVASGTSCRAQILHGTGVKALHFAELVEKFLDQ